MTPIPQLGPEPGSSQDAVLHNYRGQSVDASRIGYEGEGWSLYVSTASDWRVAPDPASTLRLVRRAGDVELNLRLSVFAVADGMDPEVFLASYAMWRNEEGQPRVERRWDESLSIWRGYALNETNETYFAFWVVGGRAYVLEESADSGVLKENHLTELERIVDDFECGPQEAHAAPGTSP